MHLKMTYSFLERTRHLCTTHRHWGIRPHCTTSKHWDNVCSWSWWSLCIIKKYYKPLYSPYWLTTLNSFKSHWARWKLPPEVAGLLNKTHIPIQSKVISWVLVFQMTDSWTWVSVTERTSLITSFIFLRYALICL